VLVRGQNAGRAIGTLTPGKEGERVRKHGFNQQISVFNLSGNVVRFRYSTDYSGAIQAHWVGVCSPSSAILWSGRYEPNMIERIPWSAPLTACVFMRAYLDHRC
jgi:hypothetical protein